MSKFKSFMGKLKKNILWYLVVWIFLSILLVAPVTYTITNANADQMQLVEAFSTNLVNNFLEFPITKVFSSEYVADYVKGIEIFSIIYFGIMCYAIYKTLPKSAYDKIEHGSSDWCAPGEQYRILSKKSGLLLAKDNYLPLDKSGNVNVLIVGRIWCW